MANRAHAEKLGCLLALTGGDALMIPSDKPHCMGLCTYPHTVQKHTVDEGGAGMEKGKSPAEEMTSSKDATACVSVESLC